MQEKEIEITILDDKKTNHEVPLYSTYFLGLEDKETEQKFGSIGFSERALASINKTSLEHIEHEVGGFLIGWIDNGIKYVADVLTYIPQDLAAGQFNIIQGEADMQEQLATINQIQTEGNKQLQILGWWHTHPPGTTTQSGYPPIPGGGVSETQGMSGDLGINKMYSDTLNLPQEMMIVETTTINQPIRFALWRWDNTPENESAYFQTGIRVLKDQEERADADLPLPEYWTLPPDGQKQRNLRTRPEDVISVTVD